VSNAKPTSGVDPEPTVRKIECFEILCAGCGTDPFEEGIPHFTSTVEAVKYLPAWVWDDPERPVCPNCHVKALCARDGHVWGDWRECLCGGRIAEHATACRRVRYCERDHEDYGSCSARQKGDRHEHVRTDH
jgi:hypothetical protein